MTDSTNPPAEGGTDHSASASSDDAAPITPQTTGDGARAAQEPTAPQTLPYSRQETTPAASGGWVAPAAAEAQDTTAPQPVIAAAAPAQDGAAGVPPTPPVDSAQATAAEAAEAQPSEGSAFRKRADRRGLFVPLVSVAVIAALVGGGTGAGIALAVAPKDTTSASSGTSNITINNSKSATVISAVAAKAAPSVVTISVTASSASGTGSGIVLSSDGYILTNNHVVTLDGESSSGTIQVTTSNNRIYAAKIVGTDATNDLAVIKLTNASGLTAASWADSSKLNVGDTAIAIGAPLGLSNTVTNGIVSALGRSISVASSAVPDSSGDSSSESDSPFNFWNNQEGGSSSSTTTSTVSLAVIQTDAAINPGNSGGALLNANGEVIGVNVAIASASSSSSSSSQSGSIGVGFAIPSNVAYRIANELKSGGTATHGLLGATVGDVTSGSVEGAVVKSVVSGGAAAAAGLKAGDVVTSFNGISIASSTDLTAQVRALAGGSSAKLTYVRDGSSTTVSVTLGTYKS